jgi:antitoxin CptB
MDLLFGTFADEKLSSLTDAQLDAHEKLMDAQDQDLLVWLTGQEDTPNDLQGALSLVKDHFLSKKAT